MEPPEYIPPATPAPVWPLPPINWRRAGDRLLNAVLGAVAAVILTWLAPFVRPAAPDLLPSAPAAIQAARGAEAAEVLTDAGFLDPAE